MCKRHVPTGKAYSDTCWECPRCSTPICPNGVSAKYTGREFATCCWEHVHAELNAPTRCCGAAKKGQFKAEWKVPAARKATTATQTPAHLGSTGGHSA